MAWRLSSVPPVGWLWIQSGAGCGRRRGRSQPHAWALSLSHRQPQLPLPETPTGYWQLASACRGLSSACSALDTPVTGGNVSLYNETRMPDGSMLPIHPTPVVGMVGLVHDLSHVRGQAWQDAGDVIWILGVPLERGRLQPMAAWAWPVRAISSGSMEPSPGVLRRSIWSWSARFRRSCARPSPKGW